jgi:thiamine biosynthesis lipoprotein
VSAQFAAPLVTLLLLPRLLSATLVTEVHYVMGTYLRATVEHADVQQARRAMRMCFATARREDERCSRFDAGSELARLNAGSASTIKVSAEMAALLRRAQALRVATDGAFDVSVGALTALWRGATAWPRASVVGQAQASVGAGALHLSGTTLTRRRGVRIDLDGIAKGWVIDRCVAQLRGAGIRRALLSFGESSWYAMGAQPGASAWAVEVRALDGAGSLGTLQLRDQALSASAVFGHEWQIAGRRVGHIVDPHSGYPLTKTAMAVVVAASATDAEALSKALLVRNAAALPGRTPGGRVYGALLVRPDGIRHTGHVRFTAHAKAQPLPAEAEPPR